MEIDPKKIERGGFTLIELAVVILLLFLFLIPMYYAVDRSLRTSNEVYRLATCAFLAQQKMEEVRTRASCYTTDLPGNGCPPAGTRYSFLQPFTQNAPACTFPSPFQQFKCQVFYSDRGVAPLLTNFFKEIEVRVWFDENYNNTWDASESDVVLQSGMTYRSPAWLN